MKTSELESTGEKKMRMNLDPVSAKLTGGDGPNRKSCVQKLKMSTALLNSEALRPGVCKSLMLRIVGVNDPQALELR